MDGGASWATVHGVAKSWIRLKRLNICICMVVVAGKWLRLGSRLCLAGPKTMRNFMLWFVGRSGYGCHALVFQRMITVVMGWP